jgi:hypothetical protein
MPLYNCLIKEELMDIVGNNIKLGIVEPWEKFTTINGRIIQVHHPEEENSYFSIEDIASGELYIVTPRYKGDSLINVFDGKKVMVGIAKPQKVNFTFDELNFLSDLFYFGIGYIEI